MISYSYLANQLLGIIILKSNVKRVFKPQFQQYSCISIIPWQSVLLVEETGVPEKPIGLSQVTYKLDHIMLYGVQLARARFELTMLVVIGTNYKG